MGGKQTLKIDAIGYWSEVKLDIIRDYAHEYSRILSAQTSPSLKHVYIDGFAGAGIHFSRRSKDIVPGSPSNALMVHPPFKEYYFVDLNPGRAESLKSMSLGHQNVHVFEADCNHVLLERVFPNVRYEQYRRGLCLLDPYGLHLEWKAIHTAGQMRSIEIFLNFPVADMNRNVFWRNPEGVDPADIRRMNAFWGDESWRDVVYTDMPNLFGSEQVKTDNETVAKAFQERLRSVAGFAYVPDPVPMRNDQGATVYYLFFASQKPVAKKIVEHIFSKYRNIGAI